MGKYDLYKSYAGLCVSEEEYLNLETMGIIPSDITSLYSGTYQGENSQFFPYYGDITKNVVNSGAKLFLESWQSTEHFKAGHGAWIFYDDYLIALVEPNLTLNDGFDEGSGVLPVAIPICNIESCKFIEHVAWYRTEIIFKDGRKIYADTMPSKSYYNLKKMTPLNFSYHINHELLGGFSDLYSDKDVNQEKIMKRLDELVQNCTNFNDRFNAILLLFTDLNLINDLKKVVYTDTRTFWDSIIKNIAYISATKFPDVIECLNEIKQYVQLNVADVEAKKQEKEVLVQKLLEKQAELTSASFLQKSKIKKAINELENQCKQIDREIASLDVPPEKYNRTMDVILDYKFSLDSQEDISLPVIPKQLIPVAKKVYLQCKDRNLMALNTEDDKMLFSLICKKENVPEEYQNIDFYNIGKKETEAKEEEQQYLAKQKSRMKQFVKYGEEKEKAGTNGQIKYIKETICQLEQNEAMSKFNELLGKMAAVQSETTAVKTDSAILGGLANGLAGPAAGIAAYANAERDNAMAEANAAETRRRGQENMRNVNALDANFKSVAKGLNKDIDRIMNKLCDTSSPDKYFSYLNCITKSYTIEPDGTMNIALEISFNKEPELGGMKFVIDGALCLDIKDGDKKVGEAYVCAPGFNELDLSKVGFNAKSDYTVVGISSDSDFDEGKEYTFDIKPVNIWMIEK